jgi:outer membrane protein OmpA-like peptidoglycan-associated protein
MTSLHPILRTGALLAAAALAGALPAAGRAEVDQVPVDRMRLASDRGGVLSVEDGTVLEHRRWEGGAWLGYASDLLVLTNRSTGDQVGTIVGDRVGGSLSATVGLGTRYQLGLDAPLVLWQDRSLGATTTLLPEMSTFGVGSLRVLPKVALLSTAKHGVDLAALAGFTVPLGADSFIGSEWTFQPEIAASRTFGDVRVAANLGAILRESQPLLDAELGNELHGQLGAAMRLDRRAGVPLEAGLVLATATVASSGFSEENERSVELRGFAAWDATRAVRAIAGAGAGLTGGWGTPEWRLFAGLQFALPEKAAPIAAAPPAEPASEPPPPATPVAEAPPPPPPDRDGDHVVDADDRCADVAEDLDGFEDADGCPDPDDDGDGVADGFDRCRRIAGIVENAGCPDTDSDGDRLVDRLDECPDLKGPASNKGCPKRAAVRLVGTRIEFKEPIYFATGKDVIQKQSFPLLDAISTVIRAHPEILELRIEGHTDSQGMETYNLALSDRRAKAVVAALVKRGIAAERLEGLGFGPSRPVADNKTRAGRAKNRRVEIHVVQTQEQVVEQVIAEDPASALMPAAAPASTPTPTPTATPTSTSTATSTPAPTPAPEATPKP